MIGFEDDGESGGPGDVDLDEGLEPMKLRVRLALFGDGNGSSGPAAAPRSATKACSGGTCQVAFCGDTWVNYSIKSVEPDLRDTYNDFPKSSFAQYLMNLVVLLFHEARRLRQDRILYRKMHD